MNSKVVSFGYIFTSTSLVSVLLYNELYLINNEYLKKSIRVEHPDMM